jgi:hypothetical protein
MEPILNNDSKRAERIAYRIEEYHVLLANIYENLVDRDFKLVQKDTYFLIMELRCVLKSIEEDDF